MKVHVKFNDGMSVHSTNKLSQTNPRPSAVGKRGSESAGHHGKTVRFNDHESFQTTKKTKQFGTKPSEIHAPGETKTPAKGGRPVGPKFSHEMSIASTRRIDNTARTAGEIGKRGGSKSHAMLHGGPAHGTMTASYKKDSTSAGHAGRMESMRGRARTSYER
jgi:hypothetical protein